MSGNASAPDAVARPILYVGSSTFEQWKRVSDVLPGTPFANNAIGDTVTSQWLEWIEDELAETRPRALCYYCGSNDLNFDVHPDDIITNTVKTFSKARLFDPYLPIIYHGILVTPQREHKANEVAEVNDALEYYMNELEGGHYIDMNGLFCRGGSIRTELFKDNGHHLTRKAYGELADYVRPVMRRVAGSVPSLRGTAP